MKKIIAFYGTIMLKLDALLQKELNCIWEEGESTGTSVKDKIISEYTYGNRYERGVPVEEALTVGMPFQGASNFYAEHGPITENVLRAERGEDRRIFYSTAMHTRWWR